MQMIAWRVSGRTRVRQERAAPITRRWLESLRTTNLCCELENQTYLQVLKDLEDEQADKSKKTGPTETNLVTCYKMPPCGSGNKENKGFKFG